MKFLQTAPTAVVIPVHGGLPLTARCLDSLRECDPLPLMVVVVDDGSPDNTAAHLAARYPDVGVVPGDGNLWWGGAVNVGCTYAIDAGARTLILLNNDNVELSRNLPTELVRLVEDRGGCVGGTLLMETKPGQREIFARGGILDWWRGGTELQDSGAPFWESDSVSECEWLPGMALAFSAETFRVLGGIDAATFPQSRGDADFTLRACARGYPCSVSTKCWIVNDRTQVPFGFGRRLSLSDLFRGLVIRNSNYQLRTTVLFSLRHCPVRWLVPSVASFYARYLYAWLKTQRIPRARAEAGCSAVTAPVAAAEAGLRLAFVLWSGAIGGAETFVASLARVLRDSGVDAQVVVLTRAEPLAERLRRSGVPFSELGLVRPRAGVMAPEVARRGSEPCRVGRGDPPCERLPGPGAATRRLPRTDRRGGARVGPADRARPSSFLARRVARRAAGRQLRRRPRRRLGLRSRAHGEQLGRHDPQRRRPRPVPAVVVASIGTAFVIGCVSRLIPGKGVEDAIVAAQPAIVQGARLRIAGDGPERATLERLAEQLGIRDGVSFDGWLPDASDVVAFWHACDVAITAPNDWVESFGLGAVEAMACGKPVVATRGGGLAEVVRPGKPASSQSPATPTRSRPDCLRTWRTNRCWRRTALRHERGVSSGSTSGAVPPATRVVPARRRGGERMRCTSPSSREPVGREGSPG